MAKKPRNVEDAPDSYPDPDPEPGVDAPTFEPTAPPRPAPSEADLVGDPAQRARRQDIQRAIQSLREYTQQPNFIPAESEEAKGFREELKALDAEIRAEWEDAQDKK